MKVHVFLTIKVNLVTKIMQSAYLCVIFNLKPKHFLGAFSLLFFRVANHQIVHKKN